MPRSFRADASPAPQRTAASPGTTTGISPGGTSGRTRTRANDKGAGAPDPKRSRLGGGGALDDSVNLDDSVTLDDDAGDAGAQFLAEQSSRATFPCWQLAYSVPVYPYPYLAASSSLACARFLFQLNLTVCSIEPQGTNPNPLRHFKQTHILILKDA